MFSKTKRYIYHQKSTLYIYPRNPNDIYIQKNQRFIYILEIQMIYISKKISALYISFKSKRYIYHQKSTPYIYPRKPNDIYTYIIGKKITVTISLYQFVSLFTTCCRIIITNINRKRALARSFKSKTVLGLLRYSKKASIN